MKRTLRSAVAGSLCAATLVIGAVSTAPRVPTRPLLPRLDALTGVAEEARVVALLEELTRRERPAAIAFVGVNVVSPADGSVQRDQTVVVRDGRFAAVGPTAATPVPRGVLVVHATGQWLVPGLTDMHIHSLVSNRQKLLNLVNGVTTVRDMDGFPHLLAERAAIADHRLLAPSMLVAGTILNAAPMEGYARVVTSESEVRAAIREQKAAGYDFIKVHNVMPPDLYRVVLDEARQAGLDVVGHVPHDVLLADAIPGGQRTLEHFKGYILDRDLTLTTEDYVGLTRGRTVWNCPTLYATRSGVSHAELEELIAHAEEMRYVPRSEIRRWRAEVKATRDAGSETIRTLAATIFRELHAVHARFLTGTDSGGGYTAHVPGFSLQHELEAMDSLGMSPGEVLEASTTEAAIATRREREFGAIAPALRADALLLGADPLASLAPLRSPDGVLVNGTWLPRTVLDDIRTRLAGIYATAAPSSEAYALVLLESIRAMFAGFQSRRFPALVARDASIDTLASLLLDAGRPHEAIELLEHDRVDFPESAGTRAWLARAWLDAGERGSAQRLADEALKLDPFSDVARGVERDVSEASGDPRGAYQFEVRVLAQGNVFRQVPVQLTIVAPDSVPAGTMKFGRLPDQPVTQVFRAGDRTWISADFPAGAIAFAFVGQGDSLRGSWRSSWGEGSFMAGRSRIGP